MLPECDRPLLAACTLMEAVPGVAVAAAPIRSAADPPFATVNELCGLELTPELRLMRFAHRRKIRAAPE